MRFKKSSTKEGDKRIITKFLIFPVTIYGNETTETRWFERATWEEVYSNGWYGGEWNRIRWID